MFAAFCILLTLAVIAVILIIYFFTCWMTTKWDFCAGCLDTTASNYDESAKRDDRSKCAYATIPTNTPALLRNCHTTKTARCYPCHGKTDEGCVEIAECVCRLGIACSFDDPSWTCAACPVGHFNCVGSGPNVETGDCVGGNQQNGYPHNNGTHCRQQNTRTATLPPGITAPSTQLWSQAPVQVTAEPNPCACNGKTNQDGEGGYCGPWVDPLDASATAEWCFVTDDDNKCFSKHGNPPDQWLYCEDFSANNPTATETTPRTSRPSATLTAAYTAPNPDDRLGPQLSGFTPQHQTPFDKGTLAKLVLKSSESVQLNENSSGKIKIFSYPLNSNPGISIKVFERDCSTISLIPGTGNSWEIIIPDIGIWQQGLLVGGANTFYVLMSGSCLVATSDGIRSQGFDTAGAWIFHSRPESKIVLDSFADPDGPIIKNPLFPSGLNWAYSQTSGSMVGGHRGIALKGTDLNEDYTGHFEVTPGKAIAEQNDLAIFYGTETNALASVTCARECLLNPACNSFDFSFNPTQEPCYLAGNCTEKCYLSTATAASCAPCLVTYSDFAYWEKTSNLAPEVELQIENYKFNLTAGANGGASLQVLWGGPEASLPDTTISGIGIGPLDLTQGGTHDAFQLVQVDFVEEGFFLQFSIYTSTGSRYDFNKEFKNPGTWNMPFTDFTRSTNGNPAQPNSFQKVAALILTLTTRLPIGISTSINQLATVDSSL